MFQKTVLSEISDRDVLPMCLDLHARSLFARPRHHVCMCMLHRSKTLPLLDLRSQEARTGANEEPRTTVMPPPHPYLPKDSLEIPHGITLYALPTTDVYDACFPNLVAFLDVVPQQVASLKEMFHIDRAVL